MHTYILSLVLQAGEQTAASPKQGLHVAFNSFLLSKLNNSSKIMAFTAGAANIQISLEQVECFAIIYIPLG